MVPVCTLATGLFDVTLRVTLRLRKEEEGERETNMAAASCVVCV